MHVGGMIWNQCDKCYWWVLLLWWWDNQCLKYLQQFFSSTFLSCLNWTTIVYFLCAQVVQFRQQQLVQFRKLPHFAEILFCIEGEWDYRDWNSLKAYNRPWSNKVTSCSLLGFPGVVFRNLCTLHQNYIRVAENVRFSLTLSQKQQFFLHFVQILPWK